MINNYSCQSIVKLANYQHTRGINPSDGPSWLTDCGETNGNNVSTVSSRLSFSREYLSFPSGATNMTLEGYKNGSCFVLLELLKQVAICYRKTEAPRWRAWFHFLD